MLYGLFMLIEHGDFEHDRTIIAVITGQNSQAGALNSNPMNCGSTSPTSTATCGHQHVSASSLRAARCARVRRHDLSHSAITAWLNAGSAEDRATVERAPNRLGAAGYLPRRHARRHRSLALTYQSHAGCRLEGHGHAAGSSQRSRKRGVPSHGFTVPVPPLIRPYAGWMIQLMRRAALLVLLALGMVLLLAGVTLGQSSPDQVVEALRRDPVYVDPAAENTLDPAAADRLRAAINQAGTPIFIAILPDAARNGADASVLVGAIGTRLRQRATVAVVAGNQFRAGSTTVRGVGALANAAIQAHREEGVEATLADFVKRVDQATDGSATRTDEPSSSPIGSTLLLWLVILGGGAAGFAALRSKRHRDEQRRREFVDVRTATEEDLIALADEIRAIDIDISMPGVDPKAVEDYRAALSSYERASSAFDQAKQALDLAPVTAALEEGRYHMTSARARLRGEEPPERRLPCFFDPRHGPSVTDVEWAPEGGVPRTVPACAADAQRIRAGLEPQARHVLADGTWMPYWSAPGWFSPWAGGYFGLAGSNLLTGLLIGSALSCAWSHDWAGDFGGSDFGGGDFGGGDFGGGDFGGGDFGGGDF
jgi:hypothetical protein